MILPQPDDRSAARRARDEQIAGEAPLKPLNLAPGARPSPVETHLVELSKRPVAVAGVVENGLVRPIDPNVKLQEHARVIIIAAES